MIMLIWGKNADKDKQVCSVLIKCYKSVQLLITT